MATRSGAGGPAKASSAGRARSATPSRTVLDDEALELGTRIRERRQAKGLSLVKLAETTDLSHPFLSQVERGHARPSVTSLRRIAAALDVDAGWLFGVPRTDGLPVEVVRVEDTVPWRFVEGQPEGAVRMFRSGGSPIVLNDVVDLPDHFGEPAAMIGDSVWFVVAGTMDIEAEGKVHHLSPEDALFLAAGTSHRIRSTSARHTHFVVVLLTDEGSD
jgi:transcriptional regulator with XRE-family HTH domain